MASAANIVRDQWFQWVKSLSRRSPTAGCRRRWADCIEELFESRLGVSRWNRLRVPASNLQAARESLEAIGEALRDPHVSMERAALAEVIRFVCDPTGVLYQGSAVSARWEALRIERLVWLPERINTSPEIPTLQERSPQMTQSG